MSCRITQTPDPLSSDSRLGTLQTTASKEHPRSSVSPCDRVTFLFRSWPTQSASFDPISGHLRVRLANADHSCEHLNSAQGSYYVMKGLKSLPSHPPRPSLVLRSSLPWLCSLPTRARFGMFLDGRVIGYGKRLVESSPPFQLPRRARSAGRHKPTQSSDPPVQPFSLFRPSPCTAPRVSQGSNTSERGVECTDGARSFSSLLWVGSWESTINPPWPPV